MYEVTLTDRTGRVWPLTTRRGRGVWLAEEGIDGMVGQVDVVAVNAVDSPGQRVDHIRVEPMAGTLNLIITPTATESIDDLVGALRAGLSTRDAGSLRIAGPRSDLSCRVRLEEVPPALRSNTHRVRSLTVELPLVADGGVWWSGEESGTGRIVNGGDVTVRPRLVWSGSGGPVVSPSGAVFLLPAVTGTRVLYLDADESCLVTTTAGGVDGPLWGRLRGVTVPEGVPPGATRTWVLPAGVELRWRIGYLDPWR
ncbi:MAG: hypothetical protein Q4F65_12110 [Propionibacteriaceae bacterium]|nr:hypothetical protein [Propionibacteriaceae bacterium]